jgi:hypothetical protein
MQYKLQVNTKKQLNWVVTQKSIARTGSASKKKQQQEIQNNYIQIKLLL